MTNMTDINNHDPFLIIINGTIVVVDEPADQDRSESTPLYGNVVDTGTLKLIIAFFFGFSVTVTVALAIQISYGNVQVLPAPISE